MPKNEKQKDLFKDKTPTNPVPDAGMSWELIAKYDRIIRAITIKYCSDPELQLDVMQEVRLRLNSDKRLDVNKFDPKKRDAAIRNTIRNKIIKVLKSKKIGRWHFESLDALAEKGLQVDSHYTVIYPNPFLEVPWQKDEDA